MAKIVHLKLTGRAEKFMAEMLAQGLNEQDVFAKALTVLEDTYRTKCVARIKQSYLGRDIDAVEFFYGVNLSHSPTIEAPPSANAVSVDWTPPTSTQAG